ncbi:MAG: hypothetical protein AB1488_11780 [Nitrospirota bacterium]
MAIADDMKKITENIIASYDVRVKALDALVHDTRKTLKGFASDRKKMSKEQASRLADFVADLTKNVGNTMKGIQRAHKEMADNLKESLEKGETDRLKGFKNMMGDIRRDIKDIETYVANKLKEFSDAHADMSEELKKDLAKYVAGIVSETKKLLGEYSSDMKKAANAWQGMSKTMARARKGRAVVPKVEAEVRVRPVKEAIEEEVPPEIELEERVLEFINRHPEGMKVGDMEGPLGVARTRLGIVAKKLLDEGKVRKEENLYFPLKKGK